MFFCYYWLLNRCNQAAPFITNYLGPTSIQNETKASFFYAIAAYQHGICATAKSC
jgi:hypothetical protein